jgi:hypothetical protein
VRVRSAWKALPVLVALGLLVWGCTTEAEDATVYTPCHGEGQACRDGTQCREVYCCFGTTCAATCVEDDDCPRLPGFKPVCELFNSGRYCVIGCAGEDAPCPDPYSCMAFERRDGKAVHLCM